jgi:protein associated with RNAse G/E
MEHVDTCHQFATVLPGTAVAVRAHKYDGKEYRRWQVHFVELVEGGARLEAIFNSFVEGRTPFYGGDRAVEFFYADRGYNVIAGYSPGGDLRACYCNICTPASFVHAAEGPEIHFIDLDLDVLVWPDGKCVVTDEDDFAENSVRYSYPAAIQQSAREAVEALLATVRDRKSPFDHLGLAAAR